MKKSLFFAGIALLCSMVNATSIDTATAERTRQLYYTAKVWGCLKYYHPRVNHGEVDWDSVLITTLNTLKQNKYQKDKFDTLLSLLVKKAGPTSVPTTPKPAISKELGFNLDTSWFNDDYFVTNCSTVCSEIKTVYEHFRPDSINFYATFDTIPGTGGRKCFKNDATYYAKKNPDENIRLLALFRYWNIIRYFSPYTMLMDQKWDSTLVEFIPKLIDAQDSIDYQKTILTLSTRLDDGHGGTIGDTYWKLFGDYYLPIKVGYIDNKTVITKVFDTSCGLAPGDIITHIDNEDIANKRKYLRQYLAGSNSVSIEHSVNNFVVVGNKGKVSLAVVNDKGKLSVDVMRNLTQEEWLKLGKTNTSPWKKIPVSTKKCGYIDMELLSDDQLDSMVTDLWSSTEALIFDVRGYPNASLWDLAHYLFKGTITNALFYSPVIEYPGTFRKDFSSLVLDSGTIKYEKPIYILFNEESVSYSEYTAMTLELYPKATKIGSQTAGADGNIAYFFLPGALVQGYSSLGCWYPDGKQAQRVGIKPDIEVRPTIQGIKNKKDEVLECALREIKKNLGDTNATSILPKKDSISTNQNELIGITLCKNPITVKELHRVPMQIVSHKPCHAITISIYSPLGEEVYKKRFSGFTQNANSKSVSLILNLSTLESKIKAGSSFQVIVTMQSNDGKTWTAKKVLGIRQ